MMDKASALQNFHSLGENDKDLTMFVIKDLSLSKRGALVVMDIVLKRKISKELLTTFLPTVLLLLITFTSILFDENLFGDALAVNLTIMLVMTTIFTSKIEELPPTSDMKMIDIWLIFCLVVPFLEVILRTAIECVNCSCHICEDRDKDKTVEEETESRAGPPQGPPITVWATTGSKVAPQDPQQVKYIPN